MTTPGAHAEMGARGTRNASNAAMAPSDAREGRRRGRRTPTTRECESWASDGYAVVMTINANEE